MVQLLALANRLRENAFLRHNAIFFVGSMFVGVTNYLYYPILGRLLDPVAFGELQALVALFTQLTLFVIVLTQVSVNITANYEDANERQRVIFEIEKFALQVSAGVAIVLMVFSASLRNFFQFESIWPFILLLLSLVLGVVPVFRNAYLRAQKSFGASSLATIIGSVGKLFCSVILVLLGFRAAGAIGGITISQLIMLAYVAHKARQLGFRRPTGASYIARPNLKILAPEVKYAALVFVCSGGVALLSSVDVFVIKHYFDPQLAGEYAGISTVAKIIFFLTGSIALVLMPLVRLQQSRAQNRGLLIRSFGLVVLLGGTATLLFCLFSTSVIRMLMGRDYLPFADLLPLLSIAIFFTSIVNLLVVYYMSLRKYGAGVVVILGIALMTGLLWSGHDTIRHVVVSILYGNLGMVALFISWRLMSRLTERGTA